MSSGKILGQLIKAGSHDDVIAFKQVSEAVNGEEGNKTGVAI